MAKTPKPPRPEGKESIPRRKDDPTASRGAAIQKLRSLLNKHPDEKAMFDTIVAFEDTPFRLAENHRSMSLLLCSILEQGLESAILSHCFKPDKAQAVLFRSGDGGSISFDLKIRISYALGVFGDKTKDDLTTLRHIRNLFAHTKFHIDFNTQEIVDACNHLNYVEISAWGGILGEKPVTARDKFVKAISYYYLYFTFSRGKPLRNSEYEFNGTHLGFLYD